MCLCSPVVVVCSILEQEPLWISRVLSPCSSLLSGSLPCKHQLLGFSESVSTPKVRVSARLHQETPHTTLGQPHDLPCFPVHTPHCPSLAHSQFLYTLQSIYFVWFGGFFHVAGHIQSLLLHMEEQFPFVESGELCQWWRWCWSSAYEDDTFLSPFLNIFRLIIDE